MAKVKGEDGCVKGLCIGVCVGGDDVEMCTRFLRVTGPWRARDILRTRHEIGQGRRI